MVEDIREIPQEDPVIPSPVKITGGVVVEGRARTSEEAADFGAYRSIVLAGTEARQQILPYDKHRVRASIACTGTGPVYVGSEAQCAQVQAGNLAAAGWVLTTGTSLPVGHKQPVWLVPDGTHSATVSILEERMQT